MAEVPTANLCASCRSAKKPINSYKTNPGAKKQLVAMRGWRCESCKYEQWMGSRIPLELEHIDGDSSNFNELNLCLLCPTCHALTPTYKARNIGHGRHKRRERYREGKSY